MAAKGREKEPVDEVHQTQIMCEVIRKELRTQKLYTHYHVNPNRKGYTITRKPMSWHDNIEEPADAKFLNIIHYAAQGPKKKYSEPQTESQEIGWDSDPLVPSERWDRRVNFFRHYMDITKYMAEFWRMKARESSD
ncbi:cilia- and flagella-associated protein 144 [Monodelphis domestica]|uniref:cilia- and flagella-associated protein 144 n=1 Tax=Monodelphis domestica TaxID=13616 RepID=UPI0024E1B580|nr:cilia- and flagella-associated protein 144 [Monodelphis domestica]